MFRLIDYFRLQLFARAIERAGSFTGMFISYVREGTQVLDIGCGSGLMSLHLSQNIAVSPFMADIRDQRISIMQDWKRFVLCDGEKLPFPDASFEVVLLISMLHHCTNVTSIVSEATRVASDLIIIIEDIVSSPMENAWTKFSDRVINWDWRISSLHHRSAESWRSCSAGGFLDIAIREYSRL